MKTVVDFYTKDGTDANGRDFSDILKFSNDDLEAVHDYIQWLFPTFTKSQCQPQSPHIDDLDIMELWASPVFAARYKKALKKILTFWGISYQENNLVKGSMGLKIKLLEPKTRLEPWAAYSNDHNQLRIARVLESLRILGYIDLAQQLFHALLRFVRDNDTQISGRNIAYWYQSAFGKQSLKTIWE